MRDKSLGILLMVIFGLSGVAILLLAWLQPMAGSERILATLAGSVGLLLASLKARRVRPPVAAGHRPQQPLRVEAEDSLL